MATAAAKKAPAKRKAPAKKAVTRTKVEGGDDRSATSATQGRPAAADSSAKPSSPEGERPASEGVDKRKAATRLEAGALRAALKDVLGAIHSNVTVPILSHVLIEASEHQLVLLGTDLDMWVRRTLASDPDADWRGFTIAVPAKPLADMLAQLDAKAAVTIEAPTVEEPRVAIRCGRSRYLLACLPPEDLPIHGEVGSYAAFDIACSVLDDALASVGHAICTEETRYYLNAVLVHCDAGAGQLRLAATDGHRLARCAIALPDGAENWPETLWPRRSVALLQKLLAAGAKTGSESEPAKVFVQVASQTTGALIRFSLPATDGGEVELTTKTIDGTFPEYERVIPTQPPRCALIDKAALAKAVRRVAVLAPKESRAVKAWFQADKLVLTVRVPDLGEAREELPCALTWTDHDEGGDPAIEIGFNADYWLQALAAMAGNDVSMRLGPDERAPALVTEPGAEADSSRPTAALHEADCCLLQVLMPMRV